MAGGYDGRIKIDTRIDTDGFKNGVKQMSSQQVKLTNQINSLRESLCKLKAEQEALGNSKVATLEYSNIEKEIDAISEKLQKAKERMDKFIELNPDDKSSKSFRSIQYDIAQLEIKLEDAKEAKQRLFESGQSHIVGTETKEYQNLTDKINKTSAALEKMESKASKADKGIQKIGKSSKKSGGLLSTFTSRLKGIALSLLVFNWITKAFNIMVSGMSEGFENLAYHSENYNKQMSELKNTNTQLKNNVAAAFEPIANLAIPILTRLSAWLVEVTNDLSKFFAILSGKSSYTVAKKGVDDYKKSLDGASKSAANMNKQLASFDELENLSSGNGNDSLNSDMFEEIQLDSTSEGLKNLTKLLEELKSSFAEGFDAGSRGADNLLAKYDEIHDNLDSIRQSLIDIFTDPEVTAASEELLNSISYNAGRVVGSFANVGANIGAGITGGIAQYLDDDSNKKFISGKLASIFGNTKGIADGIGDISEALSTISEAFDSQGFKDITSFFTDLYTSVTLITFDNITGFLSDVIGFFATPVLDNSEELKLLLEDIFDLIAEILEPAQMLLDYVTGHSKDWEEGWFHKFTSEATKKNSENLGVAIGFLREGIAKLKTKVTEFNDNLKKMPETLQKVGAKVDEFKQKFSDLKKGVVDAMVGMKDEVKAPINSTIGMFEKMVNGIINAINKMIDGLNSLSFDVPDWVPGDLGGKTFGLHISKISQLQIPRLATGTVVPPGMSQFMAILGDNNKETEVVSPLSTMKEALMEAIIEMGGIGQSGDIVINIDGKEVFRVVREQNKEYKKMTGQSAFT